MVFKKKVVILQVECVFCTKLLKYRPMYRKIYHVLLIMLCSASIVVAQTDERLGAHPTKISENEHGVAPEFAHWTIALDAGFNSFDGDFNSEMKHPVWVPAIGLAVEYNFTPMWLLGLEYYFDMYRVTGLDNDQHASILLDGHMHRAQLYLGFDLLAACYPRAARKICGLDFFVAGGGAWWKNNTYFTDASRFHTADYEPQKDTEYHSMKPFIGGGLLVHFNLGRVTSLGVKGSYSYFITDIVDGRGPSTPTSKNNDGIFDITLNLRFKLECKKKTHVRNISSYEVFDKMNEQEPKKDTLIVMHVDTVYMVQESSSASTAVVANAHEYEYAFIYFDHDENELNEKGLIDVQQLATRLKNEKDLCIEIIGYADNTGTDEYNINLGYARAKNIHDELVEEHFISADRITYSSGGTIYGGRSEGSYTPNRRADIKLMTCSELENVKRDYEKRNAEVEAARAQAMADRENGVITAPEGMTLSGIARKYYGNPFCWVFIYEANKVTLKRNPNAVPPKARLVIPDLTVQQLSISKKKAEAYYEKIK